MPAVVLGATDRPGRRAGTGLPMNAYGALKIVHVTSIVLSGTGLLLLYALVRYGAAVARRRAFRIVPHGVDTILLASAVAMAVLARINPLADDSRWLLAKIALLPLYVVAGAIALRGDPRWRAPALLVAALTFAMIVGLALARPTLRLGLASA